MSRGLAESFKSALSGSVLYPCFFCEFDFNPTPVRVHTTDGNLTLNGDTYTGTGNLLGIKFSGESDQIAARYMEFSLNNVDQAFYSETMSSKYVNRSMRVYFGLLNSDRDTVLYSYLLEEGTMSELNVVDDLNSMTITLKCENKLVELFNPKIVYLSESDHRRYFPAQRFYRYTSTLPDRTLPWGLPYD